MSFTNTPVLPIEPFLDEICAKLKNSPTRCLILTAETAAGKSTAVPQALLKNFDGKIVMLEPRRLAVTAIADRISQSLKEETGHTVGYRLQLENKISRETRLEIVTEAILTRKLQSDPLLEDTNVIVIDEFHERSIHADLALALLKETMELRNDLFVLIMSATINYRSLAEYLDNSPVMQVPGRQFPVEITYSERTLVTEISDAVKTNAHKSILVFLPGIFEINKIRSLLEEKFSSEQIQILVLHSSIPLSEQKKILSPNTSNVPRVILSSAIAETSITVPDVTLVIDSGLSRLNKMNVALGMQTLVTEPSSIFSSDQRAGRAGRVQAGKCIRMWNKNEIRPLSQEPEILRTDLTQLVLECAAWGNCSRKNYRWLDEPAKSAWDTSLNLLELLQFIKEGKITEKGRQALKTGLEPRFAACCISGILHDMQEQTIKIILKYSQYKSSSPVIREKFISNLKKRMASVSLSSEHTTISPQEILLAGFPDRIALLVDRGTDYGEYQFPSGRKGILKFSTSFPQWIVCPKVDGGSTTAKIYEFEEIPTETAEKWLSTRTQKRTITEFTDTSSSRFSKKEVVCYNSIIISQKKINTSDSDYIEAVCNQILTNGIEWLPLDEKIREFLLRCEFYGLYQNPDITEKLESLKSTSGQWLKPFINSPKDLTAQTVYNSLYWYLDGSEIDSKVPQLLTLTNGKKRKVIYEKQNEKIIRPVLELIIQQIFGVFETPQICGQKVLLKLLSPARRPLQITTDLASFWTTSWIEICKEMKGRYPKHNWDYTITDKD